jgi:diguanylate cyclase (GGDEF)-like protein
MTLNPPGPPHDDPEMRMALADHTGPRIDADIPSALLHDPLTGLPNRALLFDRIDMARRRMSRTGEPMAVIHCTLDPLATIVASSGRDVADRVLATFANRFERAVRSSDTAARLGNEDLVLVCERLRDSDAVRIIIDRLQAAVTEPVVVDGTEHHHGVSIGVVITNDAGYPVEELLATAGDLQRQASTDPLPRVRVIDWNLGLIREAASVLDSRPNP